MTRFATVAVAFVATATFLACVPTALASTVLVEPGTNARRDVLRYTAGAGETNSLRISATPSFDVVEIVDTGATITVGPGCTSFTPTRATCTFEFDFDFAIDVRLGDGNDSCAVNAEDTDDGASAVYRGGAGNDSISGAGEEATERFLGGPGDDFLRGRQGFDVFDGGAGADTFTGGSSSRVGTAGVSLPHLDTVRYARRINAVFADADGIADDGEVSEGDRIRADVERIIGGRGNDVLGGRTTNIFTLDGVPFLSGMILEGRRGGDVLRGGRARDGLIGGVGRDVLVGRGRADYMLGRRGGDRLIGGDGRDRLRGGRGRDTLFARDNFADRVGGGRGIDRARIDPGLDRLRRVETLF